MISELARGPGSEIRLRDGSAQEMDHQANNLGGGAVRTPYT